MVGPAGHPMLLAAAIVPVLALELVARAYMANLILADIESEATRLATTASRVFQDLRAFVGPQAVDDDIIVWLSRVVAQDVNIFEGTDLLASSERNLFASGLLPQRTPGAHGPPTRARTVRYSVRCIMSSGAPQIDLTS